MKVINFISDSNVGGAGKCLVNYANNNKDKNIDLYVVVPKGSLIIPYFNDSVKLIEINGLYNNNSMDISVIFELIRLFKKIKPDIIHTHTVMIARLVARFCSKSKIIYTKHCYYDLEKGDYSILKRMFYRVIDSLFTDKIILVTEALRNNMKDRGSIVSKMTTVVNGVPILKKHSVDDMVKIRGKYGIKDNDFVVSMLSRLVEDKDHETFIKVAYEFKKNNVTDIKFLIVGTGKLHSNLNNLVDSLGLQDIVKFTGFIDDVSEILNITSVQVNCSIGTEATSLSLLEGYSLGVPAIVSNYGGNPYIVRNDFNGYIVGTRDVNGFYKKIKLIKDDKRLHKKLCNAAKREYLNKYTVDRYVSEINKCYYDVLDK